MACIVSVEIRRAELEAALAEGPADYTEFTGRFAEVEIVVDYEGSEVLARMEMDDGYPLMVLDRVE